MFAFPQIAKIAGYRGHAFMNNLYTSDQVRVLFQNLFSEVKHGDIDHQIWLRDKIKDFVEKNIEGGLHKIQLSL